MNIKTEGRKLRLFDAGCGNGYLAAALAEKGFEVAGCDFSKEGIEQARKLCPDAKFEVCSVYDNMLDTFGGEWDIVLSSEVIEHLYDPGRLIENVYPMLRSDGIFIITTPYHGYLKNLVMAVTGKMDKHFTVLWDGGHIKFWSFRTLSALLEKKGFSVGKFYGAGRFPWLWKSMVVSASKKDLPNPK
ncbi:MAG: class I SAM-dependent methyltransferase [Desulfocapsa sp.]|nr:class I SAM-dependent methyltransferase [Desulfocapsa sp.]